LSDACKIRIFLVDGKFQPNAFHAFAESALNPPRFNRNLSLETHFGTVGFTIFTLQRNYLGFFKTIIALAP
jgi:hypothetical protein